MRIIPVGIAAFGMSGKLFHAPFLAQHPGFSIAGIVERNHSHSRDQYPESQLFRSFEEMLMHDEIEIVVVNTPVQFHYEHVKQALNANKNVVVEKPFTTNVQEAEELVTLAKQKNKFLSVYQNRRFDRDFLQVKEILKQDILGEIREAEIRFDRFRTTPGGKMHKEDPLRAGSGSLHDLGSHLIDQAVQLFGYPKEVFADVFSMKGDEFANDYFELILYYQNSRVRIKSSVFTKQESAAYKIHGSKGSFLQERSDLQEYELNQGKLPLYQSHWQDQRNSPDGILDYLDDDGQNILLHTTSEPGDYMNYFQAVYDHLVHQKDLPSPGEEVIQNMKIIDAALESNRLKKVVSL